MQGIFCLFGTGILIFDPIIPMSPRYLIYNFSISI